ncbi:polyhydroxyalkanoic acid system family protein [Tundrisphaera sp. TA3]|uniref:polyhydroxyalkanoic acid system family protein n=1 Tax=Tundrisphaera sp. TA3 TaxID=3435775 RepID=UPI003EBD00DC
MSLINLTLKHGRTLDEARGAMEHAVRDMQARFGRMIRGATWDGDRNGVRLEGAGFWVEMKVDASEVHASGDIPILGGLLGGSVGSGIKQIVQHAFAAKLPGRSGP